MIPAPPSVSPVHHRLCLPLFPARQQMVETVMQAMQDHGRKVPVMVMIAARDVADAIELGKHAMEQGCDAVSSGSCLLPWHKNKMHWRAAGYPDAFLNR